MGAAPSERTIQIAAGDGLDGGDLSEARQPELVEANALMEVTEQYDSETRVAEDGGDMLATTSQGAEEDTSSWSRSGAIGAAGQRRRGRQGQGQARQEGGRSRAHVDAADGREAYRQEAAEEDERDPAWHTGSPSGGGQLSQSLSPGSDLEEVPRPAQPLEAPGATVTTLLTAAVLRSEVEIGGSDQALVQCGDAAALLQAEGAHLAGDGVWVSSPSSVSLTGANFRGRLHALEKIAHRSELAITSPNGGLLNDTAGRLPALERLAEHSVPTSPFASSSLLMGPSTSTDVLTETQTKLEVLTEQASELTAAVHSPAREM